MDESDKRVMKRYAAVHVKVYKPDCFTREYLIHADVPGPPFVPDHKFTHPDAYTLTNFKGTCQGEHFLDIYLFVILRTIIQMRDDTIKLTDCSLSTMASEYP